MSTQQGQTDQVLKIKLTSYLLQARWLDEMVAANGEAGLEVTTLYVGDGAPIKITVKDIEGKSAGTVEGKVLSNTFRARYKPSQPPGKQLMFEAELPKHSLKKVSGRLRVTPPIEFSALRFTDDEGSKTVTEIPTGKIAGCEAKVKGLADGDPVVMSVAVRYHKEDKDGVTFAETEVYVDKGKVTLLLNPQIRMALEKIRVQPELDKEGGKYHQPEFLFSVSARGVTATSDKAPATQSMIIRFEERPGMAGSLEGKKIKIISPDGKKEEKTIPKDGKIEVAKTKPGKHKIEGEAVKGLKPVPALPPPPDMSHLPEITLKEAQDIALQVSQVFEGKGYTEVTTNFDKMGISFGIIQWCFGAGSLGPLFKEFKKRNEKAFKECFKGNEDDYNEFVQILNKDKKQQTQWSIGHQTCKEVTKKSGKKIKVWTLNKPWDDYFHNLANETKFHPIQKELAISQVHRRLDFMMSWFRHNYPSPFAKITLRGYAALYDFCVQQGGLKNEKKPEVKKDLDGVAAQTSIEMIKEFVDYMGSRVEGLNGIWRANCVSRRFGILEATPVYVERKDMSGNLLKKKTENKNFSLLTQDKVLKDY